MSHLETLKTITVLILACLIAHLIFGAKWLLWIAILLCVGNAFESRITAAIAKYWMRLAFFLGKINSRIVLALMFFIVLTPIALLYRLFNRKAVDHFRKNNRSSYFDDVHKSYGQEDFEKLW
jgi:predicted membrane protein